MFIQEQEKVLEVELTTQQSLSEHPEVRRLMHDGWRVLDAMGRVIDGRTRFMVWLERAPSDPESVGLGGPRRATH